MGSGTYRIWLEEEVHKSRNDLPGKVRQRIKRLIDALAEQPRPYASKILDTGDLILPPRTEIRRNRLENWRIVYAVSDAEKWVWVLAVRQRPPYGYEDLPELASRLSE